jgi:hypothetical protein
LKIQLKIAEPSRKESSVARNDASWQIEDADSAVEITAEYGGVIKDFGIPERGASKKTQVGRGFHHIWMIVAITACIGFLVVLIHDVVLGLVTFKIFMDYVVYVLAGLGIAGFKKSFDKSSTD